MAAKCPECGHTLKLWNVKAECPKCGVNIPNHQWEKRLNDDADFAENAFARFHYKLQNFKSAVFGTKLRIVRLILTFAPLIALVLPLYSFKLNLPFNQSDKSISFLTFVLDYLLESDIGSVTTLMGGEVLGTAATMVVIACVLMLLAVVFGVLNFFVLLIAGIKMKYVFNVVLNVLATVCWAVSSVFFAQFTTACEALGGGIVTECSLGFGFIVGCVLFLVNVVMNIIVGKGLKKQLNEQPSIDEFVANEIAELRKQA
ncbi:MAG: hypothetical protein IJZ16_04345 [Clostridia bacterium]|nr:hypothetical protein [Clostridia bacterium]